MRGISTMKLVDSSSGVPRPYKTSMNSFSCLLFHTYMADAKDSCPSRNNSAPAAFPRTRPSRGADIQTEVLKYLSFVYSISC